MGTKGTESCAVRLRIREKVGKYEQRDDLRGKMTW